jgi:hypothetical protein
LKRFVLVTARTSPIPNTLVREYGLMRLMHRSCHT